MLVFARKSHAGRTSIIPSDEAAMLLQMEERLPPMLSVIAGMVDLTGFFMLGNIFTAHITGNLVVASALVVRGGPLNPAAVHTSTSPASGRPGCRKSGGITPSTV